MQGISGLAEELLTSEEGLLRGVSLFEMKKKSILSHWKMRFLKLEKSRIIRSLKEQQTHLAKEPVPIWFVILRPMLVSLR